MEHLDGDLENRSHNDLIAEVVKLRTEIRYHRDRRGHDRCWLDDVKLYRTLPETKEAEFTLPNHDEFLTNCEKYWRDRQPCPAKRGTP